MNKPAHASEEMAAFFDKRADGYEQHMLATVEDPGAFYASLAEALPNEPIRPVILDLGVGTGLELDAVFERFPRASVTGIDVSAGMIRRLGDKRRAWSKQVRTIHGSFLTLDLGRCVYDAVISAMALHHWTPSIKLGLYRRIQAALRPGSAFINADYVVSPDEAASLQQMFENADCEQDHLRHIDLPLSEDQEIGLLRAAGFDPVAVTFRRANACTFRATVPPEAREATG